MSTRYDLACASCGTPIVAGLRCSLCSLTFASSRAGALDHAGTPWVECLSCGRDTAPGPRCAPCTRRWEQDHSIRGYGGYRRARAVVLVEERVCWRCGKPGTAEDPLTADHVVPRAHGGGHTRKNLRAAHLSCNSSRGARCSA